ncbi:MAG: hypothetical protein JWO98_4760 [Frankiales bacterium]|nr:hypothetical protein [Frankiales bacterium]
MSGTILTADEISRFWSKIRKAEPGACWAWTKEVNNKGYGRFTIYRHGGRARFLTHRLAYQLTTGRLLGSAVLLHSCDNPPCCNPAHLTPGTQADNVADSKVKGRAVAPPIRRGESNGQCKLNDQKVIEIRRRCANGETQRALAKEFAVDPALIGRVVLRKSWAHVGDEAGQAETGLSEDERRAMKRRAARNRTAKVTA